MASAWANSLPHVTVPKGKTAKTVTLIYPYYENAEFFQTQMYHWFGLTSYLMLTDYLSMIVVDDGSPTHPLRHAYERFRLSKDDLRLSMFRIEVDIPWNWLAARNIGAHHASSDWLLLTDMDHEVPWETVAGAVYGQHDPNVVYVFSRREHTGETVTPHSASFFMTKAMFWTIGGYDEALSGHYGTDGEFRRRIAKVAPIQVLTDVLVRYERVSDAWTTAYERKSPIDARVVKQIIARRQPGWRPKVLSFPYREVSLVASDATLDRIDTFMAAEATR